MVRGGGGGFLIIRAPAGAAQKPDYRSQAQGRSQTTEDQEAQGWARAQVLVQCLVPLYLFKGESAW